MKKNKPAPKNKNLRRKKPAPQKRALMSVMLDHLLRWLQWTLLFLGMPLAIPWLLIRTLWRPEEPDDWGEGIEVSMIAGIVILVAAIGVGSYLLYKHNFGQP
jgi:hypothetical protein